MAKTSRSKVFDTQAKRLKLEVVARHMEPIQPGLYLVYQRPRDGSAGVWKVRFYDPEDRKQVQLRMGIADDFVPADGDKVLDYYQARDKVAAWFTAKEEAEKRRERGDDLPDGPYTVAMAMQEYLENCRRRGVKGMQQLEASANAHILPQLGAFEVCKVGRNRVQKWLYALAEAPRRKRVRKGEAPAYQKEPETEDEKRARRDSANRIFSVLRAALNLAFQQGRVESDPWRAVKPFRGTSKGRVRFLAIEEQRRLVNVCPPDFRRLIQAALFTGARYQELARVVARDFDRRAGSLFIPVSKSGRSRHIILSHEGLAFFESLTAGKAPTEPIFQRDGVQRRARQEVGSAWGRADQTRPLERACEAAGLEHITFHELRHTAASTWINAGMSLEDVAEQLGDSDLRTVRKHYIHLCPNARAARFRELAPTLGIADVARVEALKISG